MTVQIDVRQIDSGDPLQVVFRSSPIDDGVAMRILIANSVGDVDSAARWLRAAAERLECGAFASPTRTDPDDEIVQIPVGQP